ncbi:hypothetical protein Tco_0349625 [Tanacetum coccineum]
MALMIFLSANSTEYLVSKVDGMMPLRWLNSTDVRFLSVRFYVLAIIASFALTSGLLEVSLDLNRVWTDAPIIEEYESDSDEEYEETVKNQFTHSKNPKVDKKGLGYGFTTKACFVCGSLSHLIRDCDFHEKRMAKQAELNNRMRKKSSQREIRTIWNNVQRVNHKNQFVPTVVLTRTGKILVNTARTSGTNTVNTARHKLNRKTVPSNDARNANLVKPIMNNARPKSDFHKSVSPFRKSLNRTTTLRPNLSYQKDYPHRALQNKGIVDSGCSRHMTRNKAHTLLNIKTLMVARCFWRKYRLIQKIKGKRKLKEEDESDTESEGISESEKKFKQLVRDEEMARKVQEDWEAEEEVKKLAEEEAIKAALSNESKDPDQKSLKKRVVKETPKKEDTTEVPAKQDVAEQGTKKRKGGHIKMIARKKPRQKSDVDSER